MDQTDLSGNKYLFYFNGQGYVSGKELLGIAVVAGLIFAAFMSFILMVSEIYFSKKESTEKIIEKGVSEEITDFKKKKKKALKELKQDLEEWKSKQTSR